MKFHGRNLRTGRESIHNQIYLVATVTYDRDPLFRDLQQGRILVNTLRYYHDEGLVWSYAYVVMPDHLHWLFQLRGHFTLSKLLNGVKSYSANELNRHRGREGTRVWQRGFHDHSLRTEESIRNIARYVIANPIRAGLVTDIKSYSLWDAIWL